MAAAVQIERMFPTPKPSIRSLKPQRLIERYVNNLNDKINVETLKKSLREAE